MALRRTIAHYPATAPSGAAVALVAERWVLVVGNRVRGLAVSYTRPVRIEGESLARSVRVIDHVMVVRIAAVVALAAARLLRTPARRTR